MEHYSDPKKYEKEISESVEMYRLAKSVLTTTPAKVLNLACGNAVGSEHFCTYFPDVELVGVDIEKYQFLQWYIEQGTLRFIQADLFIDPPADLQTEMRASTVWIAIHACRTLADRIVELFEQHASAGSWLFLMPCCLQSRKVYSQAFGHAEFTQMLNEERQSGMSDANRVIGAKAWVSATMSRARNKLLARSPSYVRTVQLPAIPSLYNEVLLFCHA